MTWLWLFSVALGVAVVSFTYAYGNYFGMWVNLGILLYNSIGLYYSVKHANVRNDNR